MRKTVLNMVYELAKTDKRVFFIGSDLAFGVLDEFKKYYPDRFFMEGICEQAIIGMAAGLAMEGKIPYVNTITSFITRRAYEQVALDLCLHNLNVRLIGNGGGFVYAPLGPTHQTIEDFAIMRALPNMTVIAVADAEEMKRMMRETLNWKGPIYIRLAKGYDPVVTSSNEKFKIGKAVHVRDGKDALILTTGITLKFAIEAAVKLKEDGIDAAILHIPTIKPFDSEIVYDYINKVKAVVTIEEHSIIGGLGGTVSELMAEGGFVGLKRLKRLGVPDCFSDKYGSQSFLLDYYGISTAAIVTNIKSMLGK